VDMLRMEGSVSLVLRIVFVKNLVNAHLACTSIKRTKTVPALAAQKVSES
jgi:hypothetical protein